MIQANELRIGNIVKAENEVLHMTTFAQIKSISEKEVKWVSVYSKADAGYEQDDTLIDIEAWELTPELLEKCGFENVGFFEKDIRTSDCWATEYIRPEENSARQRIIILPYQLGRVDYLLGVENARNDFRIGITAIESLHHLQNAYYVLTQTELQITL